MQTRIDRCSDVRKSCPRLYLPTNRVLGLEWLYEEAQIIHGNLSLNTVMYSEQDGRVYAVLNDYDLASQTGIDEPLPQQCTGTLPYMALDLLDPSTRQDGKTTWLKRFDLESFVYLLFLHLTGCASGPEITDNYPYIDWTLGGVRSVMLKKSTWMFRLGTIRVRSEHAPFVDAWLHPLRRLLQSGYIAQDLTRVSTRPNERAVWDEGTLGDNVTFEKFAKILFQPVNADDVDIWDMARRDATASERNVDCGGLLPSF